MIVDYHNYRIWSNRDNSVEQLVCVLLLPDLVLSMIGTCTNLSGLTSKKRLLSATETPRQRVRSSVASLGHASMMVNNPSPTEE
jgi:hypothetical protein